MSAVAVNSAKVLCGHGPGQLIVLPSQVVLRVGGQPVLLVKDIEAVHGSAGCTNPSANLPPCTGTDPAAPPPTGSRVLLVNGEPVVLDSTTGTTDQKGSISVESAGQDRLTES